MKRDVIHSESVEPVHPGHESEGNGSSTSHPMLSRTAKPVDLYVSVQKLWRGRRTLLWTVGVFVVAALVYLMGGRSEYTSSSALMPEQKAEAAPSIAGMDLLQEFGGIFPGLDAGGMFQQQNALPVEIYPEILRSTPILLELLDSPVFVPRHGRQVPLRTFMTELEPFSLWDWMGEGLAGLKRSATGWARPGGERVLLADSTVVVLTEEEVLIVEDLRDRVGASLDQKTGILSVSVTLPDPQVSAQVASAAVSGLTDYITRYRRSKLERDLQFVTGRYEDAELQFNAALDNLATFRDQNRNLARSTAQTEEQRLQAQYELAYSVYSSLATRLEESKIKLQETTPVFQVLQPVEVPHRRSHPKLVLVLLLSVLGGLVLGSVVILGGIDGDRLKRTFTG